MDTNKSRANYTKNMRAWMDTIREEWQKDNKGYVNYCRYIESEYKIDYNYACGLSRKFYGNPIKRNGEWLWKS